MEKEAVSEIYNEVSLMSEKQQSRKRLYQKENENLVTSSFETEQIAKYPEMENLLQEVTVQVEKLNHFVYALVLLKKDGKTFDRIFYIGETNSLDNRFEAHKKDHQNEKKWEYFKNYPFSRIRMIELYKGKMEICKSLEKLLIKHGEVLGLNLTNNSPNMDIFDIENISGLSQLIICGKERNKGKNADKVKLEEKAEESAKKRRTKFVVSKRYKKMISNFSPSNNQKMDVNILNLQLSEDIRRMNIQKLQKPNLMINGNTLIVSRDSILDYKTLPGTFYNLEENEISEMFKDDEAAVTFAVRIGGILNEQTCKKHVENRPLKLQKNNGTNNWRWRCHDGNTESLVNETLFKCHGISISILLQIIFNISRNLSVEPIINQVNNNNVANAFVKYIKECIVDVELQKISTSQNLTSENLRQKFFKNTQFDHFGIILYWIIDNRGVNSVKMPVNEISNVEETPKIKRTKEMKLVDSGESNRILLPNVQQSPPNLNLQQSQNISNAPLQSSFIQSRQCPVYFPMQNISDCLPQNLHNNLVPAFFQQYVSSMHPLFCHQPAVLTTLNPVYYQQNYLSPQPQQQLFTIKKADAPPTSFFVEH